MEIRNKEERIAELDDIHAKEIKEYLKLLDLIKEIDVRHLPSIGEKSSRTVIAQPGLRYAQADALIRSLLLYDTFEVDLCQYFEHKKLKGYADFFNSSSSFCCGVI